MASHGIREDFGEPSRHGNHPRDEFVGRLFIAKVTVMPRSHRPGLHLRIGDPRQGGTNQLLQLGAALLKRLEQLVIVIDVKRDTRPRRVGVRVDGQVNLDTAQP